VLQAEQCEMMNKRKILLNQAKSTSKANDEKFLEHREAHSVVNATQE
jgi:hypothetical protein